MQRIGAVGVGALLLLTLAVAAAAPAGDPFSDPMIRKFVNTKLAAMSLKEKIGQMTQLDISYFLQKDKSGNPVAALDTNLLQKVVSQYGIGSIANSPFAAGMLPLTPGGTPVSGFNWIEFTNTIQKIATGLDNSSVPILYYVDHVHGANYVYGATLFPHAIGLAATWNPALVTKAAAIAAKDSRTANLPLVGSPILDVALNPLWPSMYGTLGVATVLGLQGNTTLSPGGANPTNVASMLKHFIGVGDPISGKAKSTSWISTRMLKRYFMPPFEAAIAAGAPSVMIGPGSINGVPIHASGDLLQTMLRTSLKFTGVITSGPGGIDDLRTLHHVAPTAEKAVALAVQAGVELSMNTQDLSFADTLYSLAQTSPTIQKLIDQAAGDILALKKALGLFDNPYGSMTNPNIPTVGSNADGEFAIQVARESVTLLKNDGILPLNSTYKNIILSGPTGNTIGGLSGGYTFHKQGASEAEWGAYAFSSTLLLNINQQAPAGSTVGFSLGCNFTDCPEVAMADAYNLAQKADLLILTVGEDSVNTDDGDIESLELSPSQLYLLRNLSSLGKPMIIVLVEGRPRILPQSVIASANAIIHAYLPGPQGGQAVAEVLWGITNPSGKLPYTYHARTGDIRVPYYHSYSDPGTPLYPFGFGLSFSNFEYSDLTVSSLNVRMGQSVGVSVTVKNTGKVAGMEVVQLYLSDVYASVAPEVKMLRRFTKLNITAGQSVKVQFTLDETDMSFIGIDDAPTIEPGEFIVSIGGLTASFNVLAPSSAETTPTTPKASLEDRRHQLFAEYERKKLELGMELKKRIDALEDDDVHV
ncbi:glycosyl hydrolase domain containing protein [Acanthamoeba castellanii str. Neff]|uniref:beta-glucosidase n=1 Tax=Acanthamoeba castellanii (strain ATCC 30010 / Neff) TaxID=1257118 RepID=L8GTX5_ACACF|nr:glycosyl hydrolase domain containing protein [Acanthamoeba castellanii str. Neff]ELR16397.1 glycosyl hydrolase domain containing protein [Acanthamoeba castellanii str. Neff]